MECNVLREINDWDLHLLKVGLRININSELFNIASMLEQCHVPNLKALKEDLKKWNEEEFGHVIVKKNQLIFEFNELDSY